MRAVIAAVVLCLVATGCVSSRPRSTPYPSDWPERNGLTDCRVTGTYQDAGELRAISSVSPGQNHGHLSWLLREGRPGPFDDSANPELQVWLERDSPRMRLGPEHSAQIEELHSEGGVVCGSDGALMLRFEAVTATAYRHTVITLWSATDGSLIVRMRVKFTEKGLPGLLPDSSAVLWFRFQRVIPTKGM